MIRKCYTQGFRTCETLGKGIPQIYKRFSQMKAHWGGMAHRKKEHHCASTLRSQIYQDTRVFCITLSEPVISAYFNKYTVVSFKDPRTSLFSSSDTASLAVSFPGPFWKPLVWLECNQLSLHCIPGLYNGPFKPLILDKFHEP